MTRSLSLLIFASSSLLACKDKLTDEGPVTGDDDDDDDTTGDDDDTSPPQLPFLPHVVDEISAPRHAIAPDLDGDGTPELLVSSLGIVTEGTIPAGLLSLYRMDSSLDSWIREDLVNVGDGIRYPGAPLAHDLDSDGDLDVLLPAGGVLCALLPEAEPCGALHWLENTGDLANAGSWPLHTVVSGEQAFFSSAQAADLDGDGYQDLLVVAERVELVGQVGVLAVLPGTGPGTFQTTPVPLAAGGGPWPHLMDVDGDGDLDVLTGERYSALSFAWYENVPEGVWPQHIISYNYGEGYRILPVADLFGDGETRLVATNHTNTQSPQNPDPVPSQVIAFPIPADPRGTWAAGDILSDGIQAEPDSLLLPLEAPGEFAAGDVDDDGDIDLLVAGAGDSRVFLLEQEDPGDFITRVLAPNLGRSGGTAMADFDGDGDLELVVVSERDQLVLVVEWRE